MSTFRTTYSEKLFNVRRFLSHKKRQKSRRGFCVFWCFLRLSHQAVLVATPPRCVFCWLLLAFWSFVPVFGGIYSSPVDTGHSIDPAIASNDDRFIAWANTIDATRTMFGPRGSISIDETGGFNSLGDLDG